MASVSRAFQEASSRITSMSHRSGEVLGAGQATGSAQVGGLARPRKAQSTQPSAEAVHGGQPYDSERRRLAQDPERALLPSGDTQAVPAEPREARARQPLAGLALDPKGESRLGRPVPAEPVPSTERQEANPRVPELAQGARKEQPTAQLPVAGPTPPSDRREASAHPTHPERRAARVILPSPYLR